MTKKKPNILWIITDQQSARALGGIESKYLNTPAIDEIARNGVRFHKAYCTQPLCVPSRNSMFTGKMPYEGNIYLNVKKAPKMKQFPYIGKVLADNGYDTAYFGKWHLIPSINFEKRIHGFKHTPIAGGGKLDLKITKPVCDYVKKHKNSSKPFFIVASYNNPHNICQWIRNDRPLPIKRIPDPPEKSECPPLPDNFDIPSDEPNVIRKIWKKFEKKHYPVKNWKEKEWRQYLWAYYRLIEIVDKEISMILNALKESNQLEDTVIIFVSDHGEGMGEKQWTQKQVLYEATTRVPCIISQKGTTLENTSDDKHLVSTGLDLFPTICDISGIKLKKKKPEHGAYWGKSLKPLAEGKKVKKWRNFVPVATEFGYFKVRAWNEHYNPMGRMIRTDKYKYCIYSEGENIDELMNDKKPYAHEQLFNMEKDSLEKSNLARNEEYREVLENHRAILIEWTKATGDDFFDPKWVENKSGFSKFRDLIAKK